MTAIIQNQIQMCNRMRSAGWDDARELNGGAPLRQAPRLLAVDHAAGPPAAHAGGCYLERLAEGQLGQPAAPSELFATLDAERSGRQELKNRT